MKVTKLDMARVIVQALYNLDTLPPADNIHVKRLQRRPRVSLETGYKHASSVLLHKVAIS